MKTKMIAQSLGLAAMLAVSAVAFAHGNEDYRAGFNAPAFNHHPQFQENMRLTKEVNERQDKQMDRIRNGFYERRINPVELRKLMDEQRDIRQMERQFLSDGFMNRLEYQRLDTALDMASRHIFKEAHDAQVRPDYYGGGYGNRNR
jgi:Spy/CpxP family protein refolding chaperone